jgi:molecular chaperone HscB
VPPDLWKQSLRLICTWGTPGAEKLGEDDPALLEEIGKAKLSERETRRPARELKSDWEKWDGAVDSGGEQERLKIRDHMVDVLNRRNYVRNLVRDVNEALESGS